MSDSKFLVAKAAVFQAAKDGRLRQGGYLIPSPRYAN